MTSGGRVLGVTAAGESLEQALARAYQAMAEIQFEGMYYRRDIGHRALDEESHDNRCYHRLKNCWPGTRSRRSSGRRTSTPTPHCLQLPCDIGGTATVQEFVRHIWGVELRWAQRLAGLPVTPREEMPTGPLDALFDLHAKADEIFRELLTAPDASWDEPYTLDVDLDSAGDAHHVAAQGRWRTRSSTASAIGRNWPHWSARPGYPSGFRGDLLFSSALR